MAGQPARPGTIPDPAGRGQPQPPWNPPAHGVAQNNGVPAYNSAPPKTGTPPAFTGPLPNGAPAADPNYNAFAPPVPPPATGAATAPTGGVQPISFGTQGQHYNPTTAPFGMDMSTPGVGEQFWNNNQNLWFDSPSLDWADQQLGGFQDPWAGEQAIAQNMGKPAVNNSQEYWNGVRGAQNTPSGAEQAVNAGYHGPNNAQTAFDQTQQSMPGSLQPQFDAYYDRMKQKAMSDVNSQSAARGAYGSSAALNGSIGAGLDIEAQRAKAATDFSLQDSQNQRAWLDSLSGQGRAADLSGTDAFNANKGAAEFGLDKTKTMGDIAFNADTTNLNQDKFGLDQAKGLDALHQNRLDSGLSTAFGSDAAHHGRLTDAFNSSNTDQNQREDRINTLYNQVSQFSQDSQQFIMSNYDKLLGGDSQMSEDEIATMVAQAADERGWDQQTQDRIVRDVVAAGDIINGKKSTASTKPPES